MDKSGNSVGKTTGVVVSTSFLNRIIFQFLPFSYLQLFSTTFAVANRARPAPAELPQDRKVARVGGCSGAMFGLLFLF